MKIQYAKLLTVFLSFLMILSCQEEFETVLVSSNEKEVKMVNNFYQTTVSISDIPKIGKHLSEKTGKVLFTDISKNGEDGVLFDLENIIQVVDTLNRTNYSFNFILPDAPLEESYNLIVGIDSLGQTTAPMVVKYVSRQDTFDQWVDNDLNFSSFTGKVSLHKFSNFFSEGATGKNVCPVEHDEYGDPIPCFSDDANNGNTGGGGASTGGADTGPSSSPGCTYSMTWHRCGGSNEYSTHGSDSCGGDGSGAGWVLETSCPNGTTTTNFYKTNSSNDCPACDIGPSGGVAVNLSSTAMQLKMKLRIQNNDHAALVLLQNDESFVNEMLSFIGQNGNSFEAKMNARMAIDAEEANYGGWDFSKSGSFPNHPSIKYIATYIPNVGETMYLLEGGLVLYQSAMERRINKRSNGTMAATEPPTTGYNYIYNYEEKRWYEYRVPPADYTQVDLNYLIDAFWDGAKIVGRYATPLEDAIVLIDGKDWDNVEQNKAVTAGFMMVGLIPGGKIAKPLVKATKNSKKWYRVMEWGNKTTQLTFEVVNDVIKFGDRSQLGRLLGTGANVEAHHIIPWGLKELDVVQNAAKVGFHPNMLENGIGLQKYTRLVGEGLHGNHPQYDEYIRRAFDRFKEKHPNFTSEQAYDFLTTDLIPELKVLIAHAKNSGQNLNDYFRTFID